MRVTIRDRSAEDATRGQPGLFSPILRTVTISDRCPICDGPRGEPTKRPFLEDGVSFAVDCWTNPCGHIDRHDDVLIDYDEDRMNRWDDGKYYADELADLIDRDYERSQDR